MRCGWSQKHRVNG